MPRVTFDQLLTIYHHTIFDDQGDEGTLSIASAEVIAVLQTIDADDQAAGDANLAVMTAPESLSLGDNVRIQARAPRLALGFLVRTFDDLLNAPEARLAEPKAYFVIDGCIEKGSTPTPAVLTRYRKVLDVVKLFAEAASYLDRTRQELVFFRQGKFVVPVRYDTKALAGFAEDAADKLLEQFKDDVHRDQKLSILVESIAHTCESQTLTRRFAYLLENVAAVAEEVRNGYRLFASSFSYAKIRNDLAAAKVEYIGKIHKTLVDIQSQLLGIPVATIIVASQLKVANGCGLEVWTNVAILSGAWIFFGLLVIAIVNQWFTLSSIAEEIGRQKAKLAADYAAISDQFLDIFDGLSKRVSWHRRALMGVGGVAFVGASIASFAFARLTVVEPQACWSSSSLALPHQGGTPPSTSTTNPPAHEVPTDAKPTAPSAPAGSVRPP